MSNRWFYNASLQCTPTNSAFEKVSFCDTKIIFRGVFMYEKNLSKCLSFRLSKLDFDFLKMLSVRRSVSVSEVVRSIIGDYRRCYDVMCNRTEN